MPALVYSPCLCLVLLFGTLLGSFTCLYLPLPQLCSHACSTLPFLPSSALCGPSWDLRRIACNRLGVPLCSPPNLPCLVCHMPERREMPDCAAYAHAWPAMLRACPHSITTPAQGKHGLWRTGWTGTCLACMPAFCLPALLGRWRMFLPACLPYCLPAGGWWEDLCGGLLPLPVTMYMAWAGDWPGCHAMPCLTCLPPAIGWVPATCRQPLHCLLLPCLLPAYDILYYLCLAPLPCMPSMPYA